MPTQQLVQHDAIHKSAKADPKKQSWAQNAGTNGCIHDFRHTPRRRSDSEESLRVVWQLSTATGPLQACGATSSASCALASRAAASLAAGAYMSTYSWPDSSMIAYMISSVIERKMKRSSLMPS
jgi:hypothetical protein